MPHLRFLILFFLLVEVYSIAAQTPQPLFRHFTTDEGLPSSQVYQAMQDADGYMWFATDRGVVKYNGYEFKTFTDKDGLNDNVIFKLFQDYKKRIWMIGFSGRIFIYENHTIRPYKYIDKVTEKIKAGLQLEISVDSMDKVFVTSNIASYCIDSNGVFDPSFGRYGSIVNGRVVIDEQFNMKAPVALGGSPIGKPVPLDLFHFTKQGRDSIHIANPFIGRIRVIRLKNNTLLFAVGASLFELKNKTVTHLADLPAHIMRFFEDADQQLWICTMKGLFMLSKPGNYVGMISYLPGKYISNVCMDREKGYWITTIDDGIYYLVNEKLSHFTGIDKLKSPLVLAMDKTDIYAGYFSGSLAKMNTKNFRVISDDSSGKYIDCLFYDTTNNTLYIGSEKNLFEKRRISIPLKKSWERRFNIGFAKIKEGTYSGGFGAVVKLTGDSSQVDAIFKTRLNCIYSKDEKELFIGCIDGAYKYDPKYKTISLIHPQLKDIRIDNIKEINGCLCFATQGRGLMILMKDGTIKRIDESTGLCGNIIRKLFVKGNTIWCTSYNGISKIVFSDLDNFKFSITNIKTNEGLLSNEINDIAILNDTVWVASKKGISFFYEGCDFINHVSPPVYFTSLRVNSIDTVLKDNYQFSHSLNNISIGFESPLFKSDGKQLYQYKLVVAGDSIAGTTTNRSVQFLSLKPGTYSLFVKAVNNSGISSAAPAIIYFTILAPWYATWWFRLLCLALLLMIGFGIYKRRVEKLKEKFNIEKKQASLQLTAMRAQMNPHFIFNVMSSIRNYMQNNDMASAEKYLVSFAKLVRYTLDNSSVQEVSLEEELEAIQSFATLEMQRVEKGFDLEINCDEAIDREEVMLPSLLLQPFLENAIKHGIERLNTKGRIIIEIKQIGHSIFIAIEDNGVGRVESMEWNMANRGRHISVGSTLTFDRIQAFNKAYNKDIKARIIDLNTIDKNRTGTRVEIEL